MWSKFFIWSYGIYILIVGERIMKNWKKYFEYYIYKVKSKGFREYGEWIEMSFIFFFKIIENIIKIKGYI